MQLIPYLKCTFGWTDDLLEQVERVAVTKTYPKKEVILDAGHYSRNVYFIEEGMVRMFYHKSGKDITHYFFSEQSFAGGTESMFHQKRSIYGIETVEPSTITVFPFGVIEELA